MSSRDDILARVKNNQPSFRELPALPAGARTSSANTAPNDDPQTTFITSLESIGGAAYLVSGFDRIATILRERYPHARRVVTTCASLSDRMETISASIDPHTLENVDLAILPAHFAVAENGACWITESQMGIRALPFIAQHLALVVPLSAIVPDMHAAYERIAALDQAAREPGAAPDQPIPEDGFATFIAGPSKTADIEQSLVLGAHGPASLTVFLLDEQLTDAGFY
ncbi:MAG TPA: LUD domain-containing protein [Puia sp.]|nr:LUD domain-containing protein [Puia sp.]